MFRTFGNSHTGIEGSCGANHVSPQALAARFLGSLGCVEGIVTKCNYFGFKLCCNLVCVLSLSCVKGNMHCLSGFLNRLVLMASINTAFSPCSAGGTGPTGCMPPGLGWSQAHGCGGDPGGHLLKIQVS